MDLNQIRSFLAVTQTLNFTSAARESGVPQSTVSRQISDLEAQLGARLFYRTKRDVRLTDEGRAFLPYAQEMTEAARRGANAVLRLHKGANGRLSVATIASSGEFLTKCLSAFGKKYPEIAVDITYVSCGEPLCTEGEDPYDFHLTLRDMVPEDEAFDFLQTHSDSLALVVPKGHPFENGYDTASLIKEKFVLLSENENPILYMNVMSFFGANRISPHIVNEFDDVRAVLLAVASSLAVTVLPGKIPAEMMPSSLTAVPLSGMDLSISYAMVWKKSLLNPAASLFLQTVRELSSL